MEPRLVRNRERVYAEFLAAQVVFGQDDTLRRRPHQFERQFELFDVANAQGRQTAASAQRLQHEREINLVGKPSGVVVVVYQTVTSCLDPGLLKNPFQA